MIRGSILIKLLLTIGTIGLGLSAHSEMQSSDGYDNVFDAWVANHRPKTTIVVVRRKGEIVFRRGHGVDPDAPTVISSMSKPITGVCIGTLIRDGRLAFTTPLRDALAAFFRRHGPSADRRLESITIEQLLTHRSGLHGIGESEPMQEVWRRRAAQGLGHLASPEPLLVEHFKHSLAHDPGSTAAYSNAGFIVLTQVIEEVSGRSYEDYCRIAVFNEFGIASARLHPDWRMFSGARGWIISGVDYLTFLDVFDPSNPFLGGSVKQWIIAAKTKRKSEDGDWFDGLGLPTAIRPDGWHVVHSGVLLNFQGKSHNGQLIEANSHSHAYRDSTGFSVFLAMTPVMMGEVLGKLDEALQRVRDQAQKAR